MTIAHLEYKGRRRRATKTYCGRGLDGLLYVYWLLRDAFMRDRLPEGVRRCDKCYQRAIKKGG